MGKSKIQAPARSVAVHLDVEEVSVLSLSTSLAFRHWNEKKQDIERWQLDGWRLEAALCDGKIAAVRSVEKKLGAMPQHELPFNWKAKALAVAVTVLAVLVPAGCVSSLTPKEQKAEATFWGSIVKAFTAGAVEGAVDSLQNDEGGAR